MQEVQEYGQPPVDIVQEIAPGLEVNEDGVPIFDGNPFGIPGMGGGNNEDCSIM